MVNGHLRTIGIVDFQTVALFLQLVTDDTEAVGGTTGEQCGRFHVTVDAGTDEIEGAIVADLENSIRNHFRNHHKVAGVSWVDRFFHNSLLRTGGLGARRQKNTRHRP